MRRHPPVTTLTDTLFPCTTLFRSQYANDHLYTNPVHFPRQGTLHRAAAVAPSCQSPCPTALPVPTRPVRAIAARYVTPNPSRLLHRRSEEHTSELQSLMRISYAVFCLKKKKKTI